VLKTVSILSFNKMVEKESILPMLPN